MGTSFIQDVISNQWLKYELTNIINVINDVGTTGQPSGKQI